MAYRIHVQWIVNALFSTDLNDAQLLLCDGVRQWTVIVIGTIGFAMNFQALSIAFGDVGCLSRFSTESNGIVIFWHWGFLLCTVGLAVRAHDCKKSAGQKSQTMQMTPHKTYHEMSQGKGVTSCKTQFRVHTADLDPI